MKRLVTRIAVVVAALAVLVGGTSLASTAKAINPTQTTVTGVINYEYWDLEAFWKPLLAYYGKSYTRPGVQYYDYSDSYGRMVDLSTPCGSTATQHGSEGFYCSLSQTIYMDYNQQVSNLSRFGDGSVGFWLAHEFGHHIQTLANIHPQIVPNVELEADCFAGMYVHYGIYNSYRLAGNDYQEARNQIWALSWGDTAHGTPQQRLNNFDWGYSHFSFASCVNGYN
jgi:predicted metalloprotease